MDQSRFNAGGESLRSFPSEEESAGVEGGAPRVRVSGVCALPPWVDPMGVSGVCALHPWVDPMGVSGVCALHPWVDPMGVS
eukprot:6437774-Pyramimonas_sp.AAC.1